MGYRRLLRNYMHHVERILGTPGVELIEQGGEFSARDLGELRGIAAELSRTTTAPAAGVSELLRQLLHSHELEPAQAAAVSGLPLDRLERTLDADNGAQPLTPGEFVDLMLAISQRTRELARERALSTN